MTATIIAFPLNLDQRIRDELEPVLHRLATNGRIIVNDMIITDVNTAIDHLLDPVFPDTLTFSNTAGAKLEATRNPARIQQDPFCCITNANVPAQETME